jgi:hypothetical protein
MEMERGTRIYSSGHLAQLFQRGVLHIRTAAQELGITPVLWINDVDYFDANAMVQLSAHFIEQERQEVMRRP